MALDTLDPISGLDLSPTIAWYTQNQDELSERLGTIEDLFPQVARDRSITRDIVDAPALFFHRDSTPTAIQTTSNPDEALSPTAIIPSYIDYSPWREVGVPTADIYLYQVPDVEGLEISDKVKAIIRTEGLIHEYAHSISAKLAYIDNYQLRFPDGTEHDGMDLLLEFAQLTGNLPAMSHYSSTYRVEGGDYPEDTNAWTTAVSEELAETIAGYLLGFAFCEDERRRMNPLNDRRKVAEFIGNFLNAEEIR